MALTPEQRESLARELRAMRDRGATREEMVAYAQSREAQAAPVASATSPESVAGYDVMKQVGKQGLGALESVLSVVGAPQAAVTGAIGKYVLGRKDVDPISNVMTPAFSRQSMTGYAREALDEAFPDAPDWVKTAAAFGVGIPADFAIDPMTYFTFGATIPSKLAALEKAGRGVTHSRAAVQAAAGARPAISFKVPFAKEAIPLTGPATSAKIIEPLEEGAAAVTRGALKVPGVAQVVRALSDPGIDVRVSQNKQIRQVGSATPQLLSRAARKVAAEDVQQLEKQRQIFEAVGAQGYSDPNVALSVAKEADRATLAQIEAGLSPAQKQARAATVQELSANEQELIKRGLLDPQFARGPNYVPNVRKTPKPGAKEVALQGGALGDDDWTVAVGPTLRAFTPHTREAGKTVTEAQGLVQDYVPGLFAPAAVTNAMTRRAVETYDSLKDILHLKDETGNAVGKFMTVTPDKALNEANRLALRQKGYVRLGDTLSGGENPYGKLEQAFHRAAGKTGAADEVWVPKEVDGLLSMTLAKRPLGKFQRTLRKVESYYVPWLTYLGPDFLGRNARSSPLYNLMGGDTASWVATHANPKAYGGAYSAAARIVANGGNLKKSLQQGFAGQGELLGKVDGGRPFTLADAVSELDQQNAITLGGFGGMELTDELVGFINEATANPSRAEELFNEAKKIAGFYPRLMRAGNATTDTANRISGYAMHRLRGLTPEQAVNEMLKWQVDYSKVLSPEGEMFRTLNPFFRWMQTQFGNAVETVAQRPGKAGALGQYPTRFSQAATDKESRAEYQGKQAPFSRNRQETLVGRKGESFTTAFLEPPLTELSVLDPLTTALTKYAAGGDARDAMPNLAELARGALRPGPVTSAGLSLLTGMDIGRNRPLESGGEAVERLAPAGYIKLTRALQEMGVPKPVIDRMVYRRKGKYYVNAKMLYALEMAPALPTPFVGRDVMRFATGRPGVEPPDAQWSDNPLADLVSSDDPQIRAIASNLLGLGFGFKTKTEDAGDLQQIQVLQDKRRRARERREKRSRPGLSE